MTLKEQLERTEQELKRLDERRAETKEKKRRLLAEIEEEKNQEVLGIIQDNFGEVTAENLALFRQAMEGQREYFRREEYKSTDLEGQR